MAPKGVLRLSARPGRLSFDQLGFVTIVTSKRCTFARRRWYRIGGSTGSPRRAWPVPHEPSEANHEEQSMALEVIGAGFGRTGTMSLKVALEELGFGPCYHMTEVFANPKHVKFWEAAARGEPVDWEELFRGYRSSVDWPGAAFYEELMERYPDAKVILTVRDPDRWYESALNTIYGRRRTDSFSPMSSLMELFIPRIRHMRRAAQMITALAW